MNRWGARILGILLLLMFAFVFVQLHRQLVMMQRNMAPVTTTSP